MTHAPLSSSPGALRLVRPGETPAEPISRAPLSPARVRVRRETQRAALLTEHDARRILALRAAEALQGGRAALLTPDRRERLMTISRALGLRPFDASLIIAIVQDAARRADHKHTGEATRRALAHTDFDPEHAHPDARHNRDARHARDAQHANNTQHGGDAQHANNTGYASIDAAALADDQAVQSRLSLIPAPTDRARRRTARALARANTPLAGANTLHERANARRERAATSRERANASLAAANARARTMLLSSLAALTLAAAAIATLVRWLTRA